MLNLSDNELDRLSREAASQHDPGDPLGPQSWERLELHLDKELGRAGPDISRGVRGIRRLPFHYAPVLLLVVGVTYYFARVKGRKAESSGSPPLTVVKTPQQQTGMDSISSLKNPAYSDKSTSTLYPGGDSLSGISTGTPTAPASSPAGLEPSSAAPNSISPAGDRASSGLDHTASGPDKTSSGLARATPGPDRNSPGLTNGSHTDRTSSGLANNSRSNPASTGTDHTASGLTHHTGSDRTSPHSGLITGLTTQGARSGNGMTARNGGTSGKGKASGKGNKPPGSIDQTVDQQLADQTTLLDHPYRQTQSPDKPSDPERVFIQHPFSLRSSHPRISDSTLRAYIAQMPKDQPKNPDRSNHIQRKYTFGLQVAPDFSSVNALAGDKPGSSIGLTFDYNFFDRLHLGTGLLFSRKNYTSRGRDYHVPYDYYRQNGMKPVDFVKGTMSMLEIPINLRYDFSAAGNTLFFASVGTSSYLFGRENCNYYYDFFGSEACREFRYSNTPNGLFSSVNLSFGVETGITNDISVLIAPYMKLPTSDMGFGKVRMSSVGINFAIHFTPVSGHGRH